MSRRLTTMFYLREIPMLMKHTQEHGGGIGGVLAGGKDMLLSKMLFEPFMELWNNRSYFGNEIWDTNAPGYKQVQQALRHIVSQQLSHVAPGARPYQDEANTRDRQIARNNLLLAKQSGDREKLTAAVKAMIAAGYKAPYIRSTLQGEQGDQRMFKQLPKSDQLSLLQQVTPAEFDRYFPRYAKKETIRQWYTEHPPARQAQ